MSREPGDTEKESDDEIRPGGSAHVEDRDGGGARFVVRLPGDVVATPAAAPADLQAV